MELSLSTTSKESEIIFLWKPPLIPHPSLRIRSECFHTCLNRDKLSNTHQPCDGSTALTTWVPSAYVVCHFDHEFKETATSWLVLNESELRMWPRIQVLIWKSISSLGPGCEGRKRYTRWFLSNNPCWRSEDIQRMWHWRLISHSCYFNNLPLTLLCPLAPYAVDVQTPHGARFKVILVSISSCTAIRRAKRQTLPGKRLCRQQKGKTEIQCWGRCSDIPLEKNQAVALT